MNLYLISQDTNNSYDTYDAAVVAAPSAGQARAIHPNEDRPLGTDNADSWVASPDLVKCRYIGKAAHGTRKGVVLASYRAG